MADYNVRYRDASGKPYDNVQSQDEYGRYYDAGGNVLGNSGQYQDAGQWSNDPDQSWLDYLGMKSKDVGGAAYNALANITGALSPVGSSPEGNMALQVPPMFTGLYDSAKRIGQQGGFTGVEEFDAQLKQDLANGVLSLYGGNAMSGLAKRPPGSVGMFAGVKAKTADHAALARAEEMAGKGTPREQVWNDTGWFQGPDQKWRFEIDDSNLAVKRGEGEGIADGNPIEHPKFSAAYPQESSNLDTKVGFWPEKSGGYWWPDENGISAIKARGPTNAAQRSAASHELQHSVQNTEGWFPGESASFSWLKPWEIPGYLRHPKEREARAVEKRINLNAEERQARPPWLDYDVPESNQIVRLLSDTGKPNIFGSALATAGEQQIPDWLKF